MAPQLEAAAVYTRCLADIENEREPMAAERGAAERAAELERHVAEFELKQPRHAYSYQHLGLGRICNS